MKSLTYTLTILVLFSLSLDTKHHPLSSEEAQTSDKPILRIETGMHTAMIKRIATDAKRNILATASHDKTVRIWSLRLRSATEQSPKLLRVIRPPIGEGDEGKLYSVALDPEGKILATGGLTSKDGHTNFIYLFDVATGSLLYSISRLDNIINHLSFSNDGYFLIASLGSSGIRIYRKNKGKYEFFAEDRDYDSRSYSCEFSPVDVGRLSVTSLRRYIFATTSYDSYIRLYAINETKKKNKINVPLHPIAKIKTKSGKEPFSLAFSQDGKNLAVGYYDSTGIDVYSLEKSKLEYSFSPDTSSIGSGNLSSVNYSGDSLYAGGKYGSSLSDYKILKIPRKGKGKPIEITTSKNTIQHILSDEKGGVFFGVTDPLFGQLDSKGKLRFAKGSDNADYRGMYYKSLDRPDFLISENNQSIGFWFDYEGNSKAFFSLLDRMIISDATTVDTLRTTSVQDETIKPNEQISKNWISPILTHEKLKIENWFNELNPACKGKAISLQQYERSMSLAIQKDGSAFILVTNWSLRYFDSTCKQIWEKPVPEIAWAVNISTDGRYALVAFGDGTIRYFTTKDGKELAAFFPHANKTDWVFWTPEGYFDSSPNGEKLIGFHVNQGKDKEGLFFPASRFFDTYYRPDVVAEVIKSGEPATDVVARLDKLGTDKVGNLTKGFSLPPAVTILSPFPNQKIEGNEVEIVVKVTDRGGEFRNVTIYQNDKEQKYNEDDIVVKNENNSKSRIFTYRLSLNGGENRIKATAFSNSLIETDTPAVLELNTTPRKGKLYALVLGVRYPESSLKLNFTGNDEADIVKMLESHKDKFKKEFSDVEILVLPPDKQKQKDIFQAFKEISAKTKKEDLFLFYYSGHGAQIEEEAKDKSTKKKKMFYLIPSDTTDLASVRTKGVSLRQIGIWLQKMPALRQILFLDACHSGDVVDHFGEDKELRTLSKQGPLVFAASTSSQVANELSKLRHGIFTYALLNALKGDADIDKDGLSLKDIEYYLHRFIPKLSKENGIEKQIPSYQNVSAERDFILIPADK